MAELAKISLAKWIACIKSDSIVRRLIRLISNETELKLGEPSRKINKNFSVSSEAWKDLTGSRPSRLFN